MNRLELQSLSELRVRDAQALLNAGSFEGAYYLAGYSVECAIKACIARQTREHDFPDKERANRSYTHKLESLIDVAQLKGELDKESSVNPALDRYWGTVKDWREEKRYELGISEAIARNLFQAITEPTNGVLRWLKNWW